MLPTAAKLLRVSGGPPAPAKLSPGETPACPASMQPARLSRHPTAVPSARDAMPGGGGCPARRLCSPPSLAGGFGHPQTPPTPDAESLRHRVAGTEGYLSRPVPACLPIDGGGVSRLGTGPGSSVPAGSPGDMGFLGSTPGPGSTRLEQPRAWRRVIHGKATVDFIARGQLWPSAALCSGGHKNAVPISVGVT